MFWYEPEFLFRDLLVFSFIFLSNPMKLKTKQGCCLYKGPFKNYVSKSLAFFDHLLPSVDIFYGMNVDIFGPPTYLVL